MTNQTAGRQVPDPAQLPAGVPASSDLLAQALQASWRRDRSVARRRLGWRWLLWSATRLVLPLLAAFALGHVPAAAAACVHAGVAGGAAAVFAGPCGSTSAGEFDWTSRRVR